MNKDFKPRGWSPTDYNPNILRDMETKSVVEFVEKYAPSDERFYPDRPKPATEFATQFFDSYHKALAALNAADPKNKIIRAFKQPPLAPKLMLDVADPAPDVLHATKFGGAPDLRRKLQFLIGHNQYMVESKQGNKRSPADILRDLWPKDPNGELMMFVAQFIFPPSITMPWDYFSREVVSQWDDTLAPFSGHERGTLSDWTRSMAFFRSSSAPFYDPRLDCAMIDEQWFVRQEEDDERDEKKLMPVEEYLAIVTEAIPQQCQTHMENSDVRWSSESKTIKEEMTVAFDLDLISNYDYTDAPKIDYGDVHEDFGEAYGYEFYGQSLLGAPHSQQTGKRYMDTNYYRKPTVMRPWLGWNDDNHDFTWQINLANKGQGGFVTYGKIEGSCT